MVAGTEAAYALAIGYLLGSIPFGFIFTRMSGAGDIRTVGSGATGATNVLRTGKYAAAAATLIFDAAKGAAAVLIAGHFWGEIAAAVAAAGAIIGHLFPVWLGFKGGKGVATSLGVLLTLYWPVALASLATWIIVAAISRISSLSALVAAMAAPVFMFLWGQKTFAAATLAIALLVLVAHRDNIKRLLAGTEPRIGKSK
ncbi:MAG: glycerol-3-phosphate 1-O-acyltransferase PlsY [Proteobacteria bacterium]|nr:glycerol-3-phosphate 1-O-acyltransferase PlsY [Pseudomonadota bacterium]